MHSCTSAILTNLLLFTPVVLRAWRSIAVTRSQLRRLLLRDHVQTAAVWKTVAVNLKLFFKNVLKFNVWKTVAVNLKLFFKNVLKFNWVTTKIVGIMVPDIHAKFHNQPFIMRRAIWRHVRGHTDTHQPDRHTQLNHKRLVSN